MKLEILHGTERIRRFVRKPDGRSDRSASHKS
jgi:hypothetical protein